MHRHRHPNYGTVVVTFDAKNEEILLTAKYTIMPGRAARNTADPYYSCPAEEPEAEWYFKTLVERENGTVRELTRDEHMLLEEGGAWWERVEREIWEDIASLGDDKDDKCWRECHEYRNERGRGLERPNEKKTSEFASSSARQEKMDWRRA